MASDRLARQRKLGLVNERFEPASRPDWVLAWELLSAEQKAQRARDMEVYAAMIDYMDESIGRIFSFLRSKGEFDNTMIVFMSDNGPSKTAIADYLALGGAAADFVKSFDNRLQNKGRPGSSTDIGPGWAFASATPLRLFKGYVTQGGIQVPAIIKPAGGMKDGGGFSNVPLHVTDLMPTFLELAEVTYPEEYNDIALPEPAGTSFLPLLSPEKNGNFTRKGIGWEAYGMGCLVGGRFKTGPTAHTLWQRQMAALRPGD